MTETSVKFYDLCADECFVNMPSSIIYAGRTPQPGIGIKIASF